MTGVLCGYSLLFTRFAWMVQPRNYLLLVAMHLMKWHNVINYRGGQTTNCQVLHLQYLRKIVVH